jgi:hypothetical protein
MNPWAGVAAGTAVMGGLNSYDASLAQADYYAQAQAQYDAMAGAYQNLIPFYHQKRDMEAEALKTEAEILAENAALAEREAELAGKVGDFNFRAAQIEAREVEEQAKQGAHIIRRESSRLAGDQVVNYHKSGVLLQGTPARVMQEDMERAEEDIADLMAAAEFDADMIRSEGWLSKAQAGAATGRALSSAVTNLMAQEGALKGASGVMGLKDMDSYLVNLQALEARSRGRLAGVQADMARQTGVADLFMNLGRTAYSFGPSFAKSPSIKTGPGGYNSFTGPI